MSSRETRRNPRNNLRQTVGELENVSEEVGNEVNDLELAAARKKYANAKAASNAATQRRQNMERASTPEERAILAAYEQLGAPGRPGITGAVPGTYSASGQRQAATRFGQASIAEQGRGFRGPEITGTASQRARNLLNNATRRKSTGAPATTGANNRPTLHQLLRPLLPAGSSETQPEPRPTVPVRPIGSQLVPSGIPTGAFGKRPVTPSVPVTLPVAVSPVNTLGAERQAAIQAAANARTRITTLEGQIAALTGPNAANRRAALQQQLNAERARVAVAEGQIGTLQTELATARAALAAAQAGAADPAEIARLQGLINTLSERLTAETTRANEAVSGLSGYRAYANTQTARAATLEAELDAARQALEAARAGAADPAEITRLQGEVNRLTGELTAAKQDAQTNTVYANRKIAELKSRINSLTGKNAAAKRKKLTNELEKAQRALGIAQRFRKRNAARAAAFGPGSLDPTAAAALTAERNAARAAAAAFGPGSLDPAAAAALTAERNAARAAATAFGPGSLDPAAAAALTAERNAARAAASAFGLGALDPTAAAALQAQLATAQAEIASLKAKSPSSSSIGKKGPCAPGSGWRCQKPTKGGRRRRIRRKRYTRR